MDVRPVTAEYAPILTCNADCYACPYRRSRIRAGDEVLPRGAVAVEDDRHASTHRTAVRVVDASHAAGVRGFLWTGGGEPTTWGPLLDMLQYSGALGITNALYTNGFVLGTDAEYAARLVHPSRRLAFVRVSINTATPEATKRHWGVDPAEVTPQLLGLARLLQARNRLAEHCVPSDLPSIQVSTIVDRHNINDLAAVCHVVAQIFAEHRRAVGAEDRMIVRPLTYHGRPAYSTNDHPDWVIRHILDVCGSGGAGRAAIESTGVSMFLGFGLDAIDAGRAQDYSTLIETTYSRRQASLAAGLFLVVGPDASVHASTEHNCDAAWSFGNLKTQSVEEIYVSDCRARLLGDLNAKKWGPSVAQATSRTERLDRIALAIRDGQVSDEDLEYVRSIARAEHLLLLD